MALRIKELLYDEQYTIAGAKKKLASELRSPGREGSGAAPTKTPLRSLQPPPSLAARFSSTPPASSPSKFTGEQRGSFKQIAQQLREILDLIDQGDAELEAMREKQK